MSNGKTITTVATTALALVAIFAGAWVWCPSALVYLAIAALAGVAKGAAAESARNAGR